jgi:hypothetical protein
MRNFLRIATGVNVTPLMLAIIRRPELWNGNSYLDDEAQSPFKDIESISLRFAPKRASEPSTTPFDLHENIDYPAYALLPEARQIVMNVFTAVAGERLGRVMINRIPPGRIIYPHVAPVHSAYYSHIHVVLQSAEGVTFRCGDEFDHWGAGSVFWVNNQIEQELQNDSPIDCVHMIIEARCST